MNRKILLVDDEPNVLSGYRRLLNNYFIVQTATSGAEGLKILEQQGPFAALVVDYAMPGIDGVEFVTKARRKAPLTVRVMLSGRGDLDVAIEALNRGNIFLYLKKPLSGEKLLQTVITAVENFHARDYSCDQVEADLLQALAHLYAGLHYSDLHETDTAITEFKRAQLLFRDSGAHTNLLRVDNYLAGEIIKSGLLEDNKEYEQDLNEIIAEVRELVKSSNQVGTAQEKDLLKLGLEQINSTGDKGQIVSKSRPHGGSAAADQSTYAVQLFGPLKIKKEQQQIEERFWKRPKAKLLFLYLVTNRRMKTERDLILETFWPEMTVKRAANNFTSCLYILRQVIARDIVSFEKGFCWLVNDHFSFDVDQFERLIHLGRQKAANNRKSEALEDFSKAVTLYCGSYLEEYSYLDWIIPERKRLQRLFVKTLIDLADLLNEGELYEMAAEILEKAPVDEDYDDIILYKLIKYYMKAGKTGRAKNRFQYYRDLLIDELGMEPDQKIEELFD